MPFSNILERVKYKDSLKLIGKGFCMGAADVVPGVSGGTMAFILGIYARLINAIKSFDLIWLKGLFRFDTKIITGHPDFGFIIPLCIGIFLALLFFTRVIQLPELIQTYPELVYAFFFGLIGGSIYVLFRHSKQIYPLDYLSLLAGIIFGGIVFNLVPHETPDDAWFIFLSGAIAICAMILPGISGSFILLILKKYTYIFNAIGYFQFSVIIPFVLGVITGLLLFSRVLSMLLKMFYQQTIMLIGGMLVASLWVIWPYQHREYETIGDKSYLIDTSPYLPSINDTHILMTLVLSITGLMIVIGVDWFAKEKSFTSG